ncbi:hypothetical protein [Clostridium aciditolerans]|uniref:Uncharacterized protein n=1 Tax=Clostridium aciditolerans TaxID=339861 RepID=A0A934M3U9_9CLOT|nr:hypothetical protein [Clostridium aciditolerans]MBI6873420.1 hypothetical protein [Clostridium aciditolerans]
MSNDITKAIVKITYNDKKSNRAVQGTGIIVSLPDAERDAILTVYHVIDEFDGNKEHIKIDTEYKEACEKNFTITEVLYDKSDVEDLDVAVIYIEKLKWFSKEDNMILPKDFSSSMNYDVKLAGFPSLIDKEGLDLSYLPINVIVENYKCPRIMLTLKQPFATRGYFEEEVAGMSGGPLYCEINDKIYLLGLTKKIPVNKDGEAFYYIFYVWHIKWYLDKIKELYECDISLSKEPVLQLKEDVDKLNGYSKFISDIIKDKIGGELQLPRDGLINDSEKKLRYNDVLFILGEPMVGKSVVTKLLANKLKADNLLFMFSAKRFNGKDIDEFLHNKNVKNRFEDILAFSKTKSDNYIIVDGLENAIDENRVRIIYDLISIVIRVNQGNGAASESKNQKWKLIFSCRTYQSNNILSNVKDELNRCKVKYDSISINALDKKDINEVISKFPILNNLSIHKNLEKIIWRPAILDIMTLPYKDIRIEDDNPDYSNEIGLIQWFGDKIIRLSEETYEGKGKPDKREQLLFKIIRKDARIESIMEMDSENEAMKGLLSDRILIKEGNELKFAHDVYEEWTIVTFFEKNPKLLSEIINDSNQRLFLVRPLSLLCCKALDIHKDINQWLLILKAIENTPNLLPIWKQGILVSLFNSADINRFFNDLFKLQENNLITLLIKTLRKFCAETQINNVMDKSHKTVITRPVDNQWIPVIESILNNRLKLTDENIYEFSFLAKEWIIYTLGQDGIRYNLSEFFFDYFLRFNYKFNDSESNKLYENIFEIILWSADIFPERIDSLFKCKMSNQLQDYIEKTIIDSAWVPIIKYIPKEASSILNKVIISNTEDNDFDINNYGIKQFNIKIASFQQGLFIELLRNSPIDGVSLINNIVNHATNIWMKQHVKRTNQGNPLPQIFYLNNVEKKVWGDEEVYCWHRYQFGVPKILTCSLMALEKWMNEQLQSGQDPKGLFHLVLDRNTSVAVISVCVSAACTNYEIAAEAILPIITNVAFIYLDYKRVKKIFGINEMNEFIVELDKGLYFKDLSDDEDFNILLELTNNTFPMWGIIKFLSWFIFEKSNNYLLEFVNKIDSDIPIFFEDDRHFIYNYRETVLECSLIKNAIKRDYKDLYPRKTAEMIMLEKFWHWSNIFLFKNKISEEYSLDSAIQYSKQLEKEDNLNYVPKGSDDESRPVLVADVLATFASALISWRWTWVTNNGLQNWCRQQILNAAKRPGRLEKHKDIITSDTNGSIELEMESGYEYVVTFSLPILVAKCPTDNELLDELLNLVGHYRIQIRQALFSNLKIFWIINQEIIWKCINQAIKFSIINFKDHNCIVKKVNKILFSKKRAQQVYKMKFSTYPLNPEYLYPVVFCLPIFEYVKLIKDKDWYEHFLCQMLLYTFNVYSKSNSLHISSRQEVECNNWEKNLYLAIGNYFIGCVDLKNSQLFNCIVENFNLHVQLIKNILEMTLRTINTIDEGLFKYIFLNNWIYIGEFILSIDIDSFQDSNKRNIMLEILNILLFNNSDYEIEIEIGNWIGGDHFIRFILLWCKKVGSLKECFLGLVLFLIKLGRNISFENKIECIYICINSLSDKRSLFEDSVKVHHLSKMFLDIWLVNKGVILSKSELCTKFIFIINNMAETGNDIAIKIQKELLSGDLSKR